MTPAPLGKVRSWAAEPWYVNVANEQIGDVWSEAEDVSVAQVQPMGSTRHPNNEKRAATAERIVACVNALAGVAEPVETMRAVVKSLTHALEYMSLDRIRDAQSWGFVGTYPELVAKHGEPPYMANLRALLLALNKSQP